MATLGPTSIAPTNASNNIGAWADFIHDTFLLTSCWVQTADTGQTTPSGLTTPGGSNTKGGYCIYRMDDALQATAPVFVRIDFGSGSAANNPGIWITIGTGSDGSGNITGVRWNGGASNAQITCTANATVSGAYGSASTNRIAVAIGFGDTTASRCFGFGIERTKDVNGADTGTGVLLTLMAPTGGVMPVIASSISYGVAIAYIPFATTVPPECIGWSYILTSGATTGFAGDVAVGLVVPFEGVARYPGYNFLVCRSSDFVSLAGPTISVYGNSVTYLRGGSIGNVTMSTGNNLSPTSAVASTSIFMRFD